MLLRLLPWRTKVISEHCAIIVSRIGPELNISNIRCFTAFRKQYRMDHKKVIVVDEEGSDSLDISFRYVSENPKVDRIFNLMRRKEEDLSLVLQRISSNISKSANKKKRKKNSDGAAEEFTIPVDIVETGTTERTSTSTCYDVFVNSADKTVLSIGTEKYTIDLNPPMVKAIELPKCMMSGFLISVTKLKTQFSDKCLFKWFKSEQKFDDVKEAKSKLMNMKWIPYRESNSATPTNEDIGCLLKVVVTPFMENRRGEDIEVIATVLVSAGPGKCPFEERHIHTASEVGEGSIRVISYNILADLYADSDTARNHLFPTCPPYAMDIDYRKQLIMKELIGYNGDLICLQEVDEKVFEYSLQPTLSDCGLQGFYDKKGGQVSEGCAIFARKSKLRLLERNRFVLSSELETNVLFREMWEKLQQNERLRNRVIERTTVLQASVLESVEDPSKIIVVGTTHLYFHPNADHIRILQGGICMQLLQQIVCLYQTKHPDKDVSLLFCGDFNSTPEFGIYRFMTTQLIDTEDVDWTSCPEECVKDIEIHHDFEMESACGLPPYTNYTVGFYGCLDYIFYQTDKFNVKKVIPMPSHEEVTEHTALPSIKFPSDHIAIIADLEFKTK